MAKALWWKRDFAQLFSTQQLFHSAFQHKKKTTNLCFPLGLMEHLSDKPGHQVSHNCHLVPHCIYFCFIMFYLLLWKLPPPIYSILASEERQETRKGLNISVFSNPFLLLPLWLLFFFFLPLLSLVLSLSTSSISSRMGWTLWSSRSTQTWTFPAPLCPSRTSRYNYSPLPIPSNQTAAVLKWPQALWSACSNTIGPQVDITEFIAKVSVQCKLCSFIQSCLSLVPSYFNVQFFSLSVSFFSVPRLWPWQQCGLYWDVPDYDQKRRNHCAGSVWYVHVSEIQALELGKSSHFIFSNNFGFQQFW